MSKQKMIEVEDISDLVPSATKERVSWKPGGSVSSSPVSPANPSNGDLWFNTSDLSMYVYGMVDGKVPEWIQIIGSAK